MRGRELLFLLNFLAVPTQHMELPQSGIEPTPPAVEIHKNASLIVGILTLQ